MVHKNTLTVINQLIEHCRKAPFYGERLPDKPLNSIEQFKKIPLTTKEDLRKSSPFGLVCVPHKRLYQYHESFGTTGRPISTWLTKEDIRLHAKNINSGGLEFTKNDTVLIRFPYAISSIAHNLHFAAQAKGACVIPASSRTTITPFTRVIDLMQKLRVTVLAGLPQQALLLAETAEIMGLEPAKDFPDLRVVFTAGEPLTAGKRKLLESIWGVPITDNFGMTEIGSASTSCQLGRHHISEDECIFEILDDDLITELEPGKTGNLVITTLKKQAAPIIRYLTGDRARIIPEQCPCGQEYSFEHHGRCSDIIKFGSRTLDCWDLTEIVSHFPCQRFWIVGPNPEGLKFVVEEEKRGDTVDIDLINSLEEKYKVKLEIEIVPKGTIYNRNELFQVAEVGKPRYIYTLDEMKKKTYLNPIKL
ncbi:MAG: phenylacetate--CoA ligase family protein [Bacillota bacterium]